MVAKLESKRRLSRADWVDVAISAIGEGGLAAVAVEPLAERLGTTKGSFYWHFDGRDDLLGAALAEWERTHTTVVIASIDAASGDPLVQLRLLFARVTELAARDRVELALLADAAHPAVAPLLARVTDRRLAYTAALFAKLGFGRVEGRRRALLAYSAFLGHMQLAHATPRLLPRSRAARRAYLDHVLVALTAKAE